MNFSTSIYQLLIQPLELLFEVIYGMARNIFHDPARAIFSMSMVMNVLLLPLYQRADAVQEEEREIEKKLSYGVEHIKKTFRGDERTMMLQTYYRQNNYKPYYTLKGMLPLLLEIPFFIAAYHFLSNLEELNAATLGPIQSLGTPDGLLKLNGLSLNLLPILMALVNIASSAVYTRGLPLKDKITLYGMALVFLVLLYGSPSGLVFYWTLNNFFSLIKNLFGKLENPGKALRKILSFLGILLAGYAIFFFRTISVKHKLLLLIVALAMETPQIRKFTRGTIHFQKYLPTKKETGLFFFGCIFLTLLTGVLIPSEVIASSPEEFAVLVDYHSPITHIVYATLCAMGVFLVWGGVFFYLSDRRTKKMVGLIICIISAVSIVDYIFFGKNLGLLTADLLYDEGLGFSKMEILQNTITVVAVFFAVILLYCRRNKIVQYGYYVLIAAVIVMATMNIGTIHSYLPDLEKAVHGVSTERAHFPLSKNGKNVVVLMLDRAISSYIPYIFNEKPEVAQQFEGFTYYPNTISHGASTKPGSPAIFGGYDYTPERINERTEETLVSKQNEALTVMPVIFHDAGFEVTVCDPVYAGYNWIPDLSIYDEYPYIRAYNTELGQFGNVVENQNSFWKRTFFCFSMMKIAPLAVQSNLYQDGTYFDPNNPLRRLSAGNDEYERSISVSREFDKWFVNSFSVLCALPEMTETLESCENTFLMMSNKSTHQPQLLQEPDYTPSVAVDNTEYDKEHQSRFTVNGRTINMDGISQMEHYHVNMAVMIQLGKWMDYLRENEVYDNTRIIIVSDHGNGLHQFDDLIFGEENQVDVMSFNALLLVKDFGSKEFNICNDFMTNADVPYLAMNDVISDPINPFTGNSINIDVKDESDPLLLCVPSSNDVKEDDNIFISGSWYSVHDDIFDVNNWSEVKAF